MLPVKNAGKWATKIRHLPHSKSFVLGSDSLLPLPCPTPLRGARHRAGLSHYHQLYPAAPSSTHFSLAWVGSQPRDTVLQDKPAARGAVVSLGNSHVLQCRSCGSLPGLAPPKGSREVHTPLESCPRQQGKSLLWCLQCFLSSFSHLAAHRAVPNSTAQHFVTLHPAHPAGSLHQAQTPLYLHRERPLQLPRRHRQPFLGAGQKEKQKTEVPAHEAISQEPLNCPQRWVRPQQWVKSQEQSNSGASRGLWGFALWDPRAQTLEEQLRQEGFSSLEKRLGRHYCSL